MNFCHIEFNSLMLITNNLIEANIGGKQKAEPPTNQHQQIGDYFLMSNCMSFSYNHGRCGAVFGFMLCTCVY